MITNWDLFFSHMTDEEDDKIVDIASISLHSSHEAEISVSGILSENIIDTSFCSTSNINADFIEISLWSKVIPFCAISEDRNPSEIKLTIIKL